ncbi:polyprenyl synthetase family protein [Myroides odoratus]|uniref:Octaprenyl-diphosphate synthase n=1 Tax=Myroides odoratus TaxID=256 RepID=A0A378U358_MYROD|nr:polyprenyl synthetase family protein [Myroides odoratus]MCS4239448.1 octaprenyl-diphosphate synthase [Myroides odoratus]MDH6602509.1 octaprenyl-diphosphate synthase [Myroides gitamensis]QQU03634.1 polyprenyl synthetase family protein [Myroides odoratus]STZ69094.1 Octaprenyl-diphosphate synthase [Myroides odoratus]
MNIVQQIQEPIKVEMELFEKKFHKSMATKVALLNRITYYIVNRKGKQMRPMFVFLVAKMVQGEVNERTYRGASVIELIHTATLVHDDVVDDSNKRRGFFSLNALWKNKIAVLVGDYLLSKGLLLSIDNGDFDLLRIISVAVREMSEGELLQIEKARRLDITEDVYYEIIRQKTATLIAACCALGAASVEPDNAELIERMRKFGEVIGMAFQIKDDLFDYTDGPIGKPTGIDIKEQKMTLPLIYALNTATKEKRKWLINSVKNHNEDKRRVKEVIDYVKEAGGLTYATEKMIAYQQEALQLVEGFPHSPFKEALITMVNYVIERKK